MGNGPQKTPWTATQGAATQAAVPHRPVDDSSETPSKDTPVKSTPLGLPISSEDYERLKSRARFEKSSESAIGHQDSSVTSDRED
jgi:hypothetical protein